jgi:hypothetical protein
MSLAQPDRTYRRADQPARECTVVREEFVGVVEETYIARQASRLTNAPSFEKSWYQAERQCG